MNLKTLLCLLSLIALMSGCSKGKTISLVSIPLEFDQRIKCTYRHGTRIEEPVRKISDRKEKIDSIKASLKVAENSSDLVWDFFDLTKEKPYLISDGDTVPITTFRVKDSFDEGGGIVAVFSQGNGAHMFVIWSNGISYWAKHNHILGSATSTHVGQCVNL